MKLSNYDNINFAQPIITWAKHQPDRVAIYAEGAAITWRELNNRANRVAWAAKGMGLKKGDVVALMLKTQPEYLEVTYGLAKVGIGLVLLNYRLAPGEINYILNDSGSKKLFFGAEFLDVVEEARKELTDLGDGDFIVIGGEAPGGCQSYENIISGASDAEPDLEATANDLLHLMYTSGTTGLPKGAVRTHGNNMWITAQGLYHYGYTRDSIHIVAGPMYHLGPGGFAWMQLAAGGTLVMQKDFHPRNYLKLIEKYKVTHLWLVPVMLNMVATLPDEIKEKYDLSSVRVITTSGSALQTEVRQRARKTFPGSVHNDFYGSTEFGVGLTINDYDGRRKEACVGLPGFGANARICGPDGKEVARGEIGELWIKHPGVCAGYHNKPEATAARFKDGWVSCDDLARQDEEGYYYIVDRKSDMIISGGMNVYPAEVENVLYNHPKVVEAAVIGVPDPKWQEAVKAYIVLKPGSEATQEEIVGFCRGKIAAYKIPKVVEFVAELPKTSSGKILKRELRLRS